MVRSTLQRNRRGERDDGRRRTQILNETGRALLRQVLRNFETDREVKPTVQHRRRFEIGRDELVPVDQQVGGCRPRAVDADAVGYPFTNKMRQPRTRTAPHVQNAFWINQTDQIRSDEPGADLGSRTLTSVKVAIIYRNNTSAPASAFEIDLELRRLR